MEVVAQIWTLFSLTGGVLFTEGLISWHVPRRLTPLIDGSVKILEMHMGINGQRLDKSQMTTRGYTLSTTDFHIVVEIPVGSPDGYYKVGEASRFDMQNSGHWPICMFYWNTMNNYRAMPQITSTTSRTLWSPCWSCCGGRIAPKRTPDTRFCSPLPPLCCLTRPTSKMVSPSFLSYSLQSALCVCRTECINCQLFLPDTVQEDRLFTVYLGTFLHDVRLQNITFTTGVLTVQECIARGFMVQEYSFPNGNKSYSLQVPFDADVVLKHVCELHTVSPDQLRYTKWLSLVFSHPQNPEPLVTTYTLPLVFGFLILPEDAPFAHPVELEASLQDVGEAHLSFHND